MQKRLRYARYAALVAGLTVAACILLASGALPAQQQDATITWRPPEVMVIQGRVTVIDKGSITVHTPDFRPTPKPGKRTPMYVRYGETFKIDISHALFGSARTTRNGTNLKVGDEVRLECIPTDAAPTSNRNGQPVSLTAIFVDKLPGSARDPSPLI